METYAVSGICIGRSCDMRPSVVYIGSMDEETAEVKPVPGPYEKALWVRLDLLFAYDGQLFQELDSLYRSGETNALREAWNRARPWKAA